MYITKELLQSLLAFASNDTTHTRLCCVCFAGNVAVATDGHTLVAHLQPGEPVHGCIARVDIERIAKMVGKAGAELTTSDGCAHVPGLAPIPLLDVEFPPWREVVPVLVDPHPAVPVAFNPRYLARLAKMGAVYGPKAPVTARLGAHPLDPARYDVQTSSGAACAVIMPMQAA